MVVNSLTFDLATEEPIPFTHAARLLKPSRGKRVAITSLQRWARDGCRAADGNRVHLQHLRIGKGWFTSRLSLQRFADALTGGVVVAADAVRTPAQARRDSDAAGKQLVDRGA